MTLWRKARTEAAGAWRSVRYDLRRPAPDPGPPAPGRGTGHPEATPAGPSAFGGAGLTGGVRTSYGARLVRRPRRLAAASAFGVLAVAGAAGSYFAVVNGIGALTGEKVVGAEPYPLAAEALPGSEGGPANSGLGRGTAHTVGRPPAPGTPVQVEQHAPAAPSRMRLLPTTAGAVVPAPPSVIVPRPQRTTVGTEPETPPVTCCLAPPPVPTPTAPVPTPHSPSATPSPTASSPAAGESPEPSGSPTSEAPTQPDDEADDAADDEADQADDEADDEAGAGHHGDRTRHARHH